MAKNNKKNEKREISFRRNLSLYWSFLKKYKWLFFGILVATAIAQASHTADKFLFKRLIDDGAEFAAGTMGLAAFTEVIVFLLIAFTLVVAIRTVAKWLFIHGLNRMDSALIADLKRRFFNHIVGLSHRFHTEHKTGALISRLQRGARAIETITDLITFDIVSLVVQVIVVGASIFFFSKTTSITLLIVVAAFIGYSLYINQIQRHTRLEANNAEDIEKGIISDVFANIDSVKYFGKEALIKRKYAKLASTTQKSFLKHWDYYRWFESGQIFILGIGTILLLYFPIMSFLAGDITIGTLVFIFTVYGNVVGPMFGFVWGMRRAYEAMADFEDLFEYDKIKNDIEDKEDAKILKVRKGEIEFKDVDFKYHKKKLFDDFNLKIKPNEKVALVGPSGCGKTTLIKLLYRLYDVNNGEILIDGKSIKDFKQESLRSEFSIVPQECVLFDDTILNNIRFSNPSASKEEVMKAIKFAQLDEIISKFPKKENTVVGERGVKLSGGEKQRVSIARALLADKKILVLDEATSALDSETEYEIQQDLDKLLEGRTSIIIAHRLSTIMKADKIVVMKNGKIVQMGKHNSLIRKRGLYRKLWNMQKGGYVK